MSKQARTRTRELREAQRLEAIRQAKRRRLLTVLGGLVILGLVAAIVFAVARAAGGGDEASSAGRVVTPDNLTETGAIPVGEADAPVTVEIYYDYMCPACGKFEQANGAELDRLVEEGVARVELRPISFLDRASEGTEYSTRTANAIATVADAAPDSAWAFHSALYAAQPEEGSTGLSDEEIGEVAAEAGVPDEVTERFSEGTYEGWVESVTRKSFEDGVTGTPTVMIDGTTFDGDLYTSGALTEAVEAAAGQR